jgi:hypothetical protein
MTDELPTFRPEQQRKIVFRGKEITTADLKDGKGYVSVRSLCEAFGLDQRAQRKRLQRQQGYFQPYTAVILLDTAEHFGISERGEMQFLRESLSRMVAEQEAFEETISKKVDAELADIRRSHEEKVQQIRDAFANLRQQMTRLEQVAGPKARLNPEQLGQLRQLVATLGTLMQENGVPKPYPGIYMDITRLTGVSRSEDIRLEDFPTVIAFLEKQVETLSRKRPASGVSE